MSTNIIKGKKEDLEHLIANEFSKVIRESENTKLILATGSSPVGVYKNLINKYENNELSFKDVTSYNLDEYLDIDRFPQDSFKKFMNDNLFDHIDINKENTNFPKVPSSYDKELDQIEGFDLTILGVGTNGHIAFNEPGTEFESRTHEVDLTQSTIDSNFPGRSEYPTKAITMGIFDIYNKSKKIVLVAWGEGKREAIKKFLIGEKDINCPITLFKDHPNFTIYTDIEDL